jgi:hypothetical protein
MIPKAVENIKEETNGKLGAVLATHYHYDHISGFAQEKNTFAEMSAEEAWLPLTMKKEPYGKAIAALQSGIIEVLEARGRTELARAFRREIYANSKARNTLVNGWKGDKPLIRWLPGDDDTIEPDSLPGVEVEVLGPQLDNPYVSVGDPEKGEAYIRLLSETLAAEGVSPFGEAHILNKDDAYEYFPSLHGKEPLDKEDLLEGFLAGESVVKNNLSITLLIRYGEAVMLFPGDTQWGGWKSMYASTDLEEQMSEIDLIKISHHGSHNGTPKSLVEGVGHFISLVPTKTIKDYPKIPYKNLLSALAKCGPVIRSDKPPKKEKKSTKYRIVPGKFWTDLWLSWTS